MGKKGTTVMPGAIKKMSGRVAAKSNPAKRIKTPTYRYKK